MQKVTPITLRKRSLPFLKDQCHPLVKIDLIYSSYNMVNNRFFNSLKENDFGA